MENNILNELLKFYKLINHKDKKTFLFLQIIVVFAAFIELISISLISPYIEFLTTSSGIFFDLSQYLNYFSAEIFFGISLLFLLLIGSALSAYSIWRLATFAAKVGVSVANSLHNKVLTMSVSEFKRLNNPHLINMITNECTRLTDNIIQPLMLINAKVFLILLVSCGMIYFNPLLSVISVSLFSLAYFALYKIVRSRLYANGLIITEKNRSRLNIIENSSAIFREIKLYFLTKNQSDKFSYEGDLLAARKGESAAISQIPRFAIEYLAISVILVAFIVQSFNNSSDLGLLVASLSGFGAAAFKLLPAAQQVYQSFAMIKGNSSALSEILKLYEGDIDIGVTQNPNGNFVNYLELKNVSFNADKKHILKDINLKILKGQKVGFVGKSGAGKTTLLEILLGINKKFEGKILIDGKKIDNELGFDYLRSLNCYVPQDYSIFNDSIRNNLNLFNDLDDDELLELLSLTNLKKYVLSLPNGLDSIVSHNSPLLSGGQKQRLLISRAIGSRRDIIYFDEGTSALDGINEKEIMKQLAEDESKTIVMVAHRLRTLVDCDVIYVIDQGMIIQSGTYKQLSENSEIFKQLDNNE